ncbi:hypothetical protein [Blastococcus sp. CT_GayMR16]|uniref:hypothetical protein n=1 Tax=Blastococcus sp. CT_GayMR16 TaxID=2559607 RepID=UPI00107492ED|nr:hypothetical protein [Blastococcus sp. CT_GayMR16]TFV89593.1 hypothetical protein E4P38_07485 [Blastococcus sp. CT_GayMR16]
MIEIVGLYSLTETPTGKPVEELLAAFAAAGISATQEGAGTSVGSGERDVEVWADCTEARAWEVIEPLRYAKAWDIEGEMPEGYQPGDKRV